MAGGRSRRLGLWLAGGIAFAGLTFGFVRVLEPFAAAETGTGATAAVAEAAAEPLAAEPVATPAQEAAAPAAIAPVAETAPAAPAPFRPDFTGPRVAILLTDVGADAAASRTALGTLPVEVGAAMSPYADASKALAAAARAAGREVWVGVPMQPKSWPKVSPGENTLLVGETGAENVRRLDWALARVGPATGITGMMGSAFTENAAALTPVMDALKARRLAFIDARVSPKTVALDRARAAGVRAALNARFLDEGGSVAANLAELERAAKLNGRAVGIARPLPGTVTAINAWAAGLEARGILLAPVGTVVD